jgi:hypothetical protein
MEMNLVPVLLNDAAVGSDAQHMDVVPSIRQSLGRLEHHPSRTTV